MNLIAEHATLLIVLAGAFGFLMAYGVGANDTANAMGTSVGAKALTIKQAIVVAMVFEFAGAYLAGGEVTETIRSGIIDPEAFAGKGDLLAIGMTASLLAAGVWLLLASWLGWPVSTTHSIVGAVIGFAWVGIGSDAVSWGKVTGIVGSWIITPAIAGLVAYLLFQSAQRLIFDHDDPIKRAKRYVPVYMALAGYIMTMVTVSKGLKHVGLHLSIAEEQLISVGVALLVGLVGTIAVSRVKIDPDADREMHYSNVERIFAILMIATACCMAFAHGSNDVANAVGPMAAVISVIQHGGEIVAKSRLDSWVLLLGAVGIVIGLATLGHRVIATVGSGITHLTPSRGFAAELAAASTVVIASGTGLPISTTQTLVGAVVGVGIARGIAALNMNVIRNIVISWVITLPAGAGLAIVFYYALLFMLA
ncbi:MAG: inorganic phosphate transporter [Gammaproteobacteria bacterium]|nr:inorganic phosphate transporter [Gammaproteobacteria bacterium]